MRKLTPDERFFFQCAGYSYGDAYGYGDGEGDGDGYGDGYGDGEWANA